MVRVLSDYKEIDTRPRWQRIVAAVTSIVVILLVPTTVLGYFSESSIPGQPLYPLKRSIESMVLALESLTPYQKSLYYQTLATKRVNEAQAVIADSLTTGDLTGNLSNSNQALSSIVISVKQAQQAVNTLQDPVQKQAAQQQLATAVQKYQTQLNSMNYTIQQHIIDGSITPTTTSQTETPTIATQTVSSSTSADITAATDLQTQITQTQDALQTISSELDNTQQTQPIITPTPTTTFQRTREQNQDSTQQQDKYRYNQ